MKIIEQLAERFECPKCQHRGGKSKRIATANGGAAVVFLVPVNHFVAVSCRNCGFTEIYNVDFLERRRHDGINVLDAIFGAED